MVPWFSIQLPNSLRTGFENLNLVLQTTTTLMGAGESTTGISFVYDETQRIDQRIAM